MLKNFNINFYVKLYVFEKIDLIFYQYYWFYFKPLFNVHISYFYLNHFFFKKKLIYFVDIKLNNTFAQTIVLFAQSFELNIFFT